MVTIRCRAAEVVAGTTSVEVAADADREMGSRQRKWLKVPHQRKWPLVQVKKDPSRRVAAGAPSVEVCC